MEVCSCGIIVSHRRLLSVQVPLRYDPQSWRRTPPLERPPSPGALSLGRVFFWSYRTVKPLEEGIAIEGLCLSFFRFIE